MKKFALGLGVLLLLVSALGVSAGSHASLPANWKAVEIPGLSQAWENSQDPRQTVTIVETHTEEPMTFRGQERESIASGLVALRQATLREFNITDWTVREFNYEDRGACERVTFTGSYTRPEGVKVQFVEHNVYRDHQMIQTSMMIEQEAVPSDERAHDQLLATLDACD